MWPQIHDPSMSASQGLGLKACATMPDQHRLFFTNGAGGGRITILLTTHWIEPQLVSVQMFQMQCLLKPMQLQTVKKD